MMWVKSKARTLHAHRQWAPLIGMVLLTACGDFMDPPSLDVHLPESFNSAPAPETPALQPRVPEKPAPLARDWWKAANDATLNSLMEKIEKQNLSIEQSRFRLQAARSTSPGSEYLPSVGLTQATNFEPVSIFHERNTPGGVPENAHVTSNFGGYHQIGLDARWELPLFGTYHASKDMAQAQVDFAEADTDAVRASVYAEAVTDYINLRLAQDRLKGLRDVQDAQTRIVKLSSIRVKAGLSDASLELRNKQELNSIQTEIAQAESHITEYQQRLARLEGSTTPDPMLAAPGAPVAFPAMQFGDAPVDVVRNRPDIRKAEQSVITAGAELTLAKADRYPKLTLEGQLFKFDNIVRHPQPDTSPAGSFSEGLTLPLFDWGRLLAAAQAKDAKLAESASAYRETVIGAITEVEQTLAEYRAAQTAHATSLDSYRHATAILGHAELLNKQGLANGIALEEARIAEKRARWDADEAAAQESVSLANLTKALGGGLVPPARSETK